jgi:hypothetical protein
MLLQIPQESQQEKKPKAPTSQRKSRQGSNPKDKDILPSFKKKRDVSETPSVAKKRLEEQLNHVSPVEQETPPPDDHMEVDLLGSPSNETGFEAYNSTLAEISVIPSYSPQARDAVEVARLTAQIAKLQAQNAALVDARNSRPAPKDQSIRVQQNIPAYKGRKRYDIFKDDMPSYKEWIKREFDKFPESPERSRTAFIRDTLSESSDRALQLYFLRKSDGSVEELFEEIFKKASESRQVSSQSATLWYTLINRVNQDLDKLSNTDYTSHCVSNLAKALQQATPEEHPMVYKMAAGNMVTAASGTASSAHLNDAPKSILTKAFNELTRMAQENAAASGEQVDQAKLFDDMVSMQNQLRYDPYHRTTNHSDSDDSTSRNRRRQPAQTTTHTRKRANPYPKDREKKNVDISEFKKSYKAKQDSGSGSNHKYPRMNAPYPGESSKKEICQFFLKKSCKYGDKCNKQH